MQETMTSGAAALEIAAMLSRNGLYILGNPLYPGWTGIAVVMDANPEEGKIGRLFSLTPGGQLSELSVDPERWQERGTYIAGGPFSVQTCEAQQRADESAEVNGELLADELTFWRNAAAKLKIHTEHYEAIMRANGQQGFADEARAILDEIKELE